MRRRCRAIARMRAAARADRVSSLDIDCTSSRRNPTPFEPRARARRSTSVSAGPGGRSTLESASRSVRSLVYERSATRGGGTFRYMRSVTHGLASLGPYGSSTVTGMTTPAHGGETQMSYTTRAVHKSEPGLVRLSEVFNEFGNVARPCAIRESRRPGVRAQ